MLQLIFWIFICGAFKAEADKKVLNSHELPSWLKNNTAFQNLININSTESGAGEITSNKSDSLGWLVTLNQEPGYGVNIILKELILDSESDNYLMLAAWPISEVQFKEIKILTGKFDENQTFRILNAKQFVVLFHSASSNVLPQLKLNYKRYGSAYKKKIPLPDDPIKKETLFEVFLTGRNATDFSNSHFLRELQEAIRKEAEAYCSANEIIFDSNKTNEEMVKFWRISFCPFDWPNRDICVAIQHYVYVSGEKLPNQQIIINYQLTADRLKDMWMQSELPEINKLGIFVFKLPEPSTIAVWWTLITGIAVMTSLLMIFVIWKADNSSKKKSRSKSLSNQKNFKDVKIRKKIRFKISKHQQIPDFIIKGNSNKSFAQEELTLKASNYDNQSNRKSSVQDASPIKNYIGGLIFGVNNKGFEDEENLETHSTKMA